MAQKLNTPVLLITFNRPDVTAVVLSRILEMEPPRLYLFNDAPRPGNHSDEEKCAEIRKMAGQLNFQGELFTRFESQNLGCKMGESTAMSWLFENEPEGIVIEDDILPCHEFFYFCEEMLARFRHDERIFSITGCNLLNEWKADQQDYHYAYFGSFWGWAGWRRAWQHYDVQMSAWLNPEVKRLVQHMLPFEEYRKLRTQEFDHLVEGKNDTWDFQFCLAHYLNHAMSIVPARNLITNIGINRADAVHMTGESPFSDLCYGSIPIPPRHNPVMIPDFEYDRLVIQKAYPWFFEPSTPASIEKEKNNPVQKIKKWIKP